jgi:hypothetical protein
MSARDGSREWDGEDEPGAGPVFVGRQPQRRGLKGRLVATFDDGPLDDTELAESIAGFGINADYRFESWHRALKDRMRERVAARMAERSGL